MTPRTAFIVAYLDTIRYGKIVLTERTAFRIFSSRKTNSFHFKEILIYAGGKAQ
jgi:hypothetical protein